MGAEEVSGAAKKINSWLQAARSDFPTSHVLFPVGDDNSFLATAQYFDGLDKVVKLLRSKYGVNAVYSTPSRYLDAALEEKEIGLLPSVEGSLVSYSDQAFHR